MSYMNLYGFIKPQKLKHHIPDAITRQITALTLVLDEYLYDPELNHAEYKRDLVGAVAFDREHGVLYVIERLADGSKSVIHVWSVS